MGRYRKKPNIPRTEHVLRYKAHLNQEQLQQDHTIRWVVGIDEVGFGSIAGPLGVGCVVLPIDCDLVVKDSKAYNSQKSREKAYLDVKCKMAWGRVELVQADVINEYGLGKCKDQAVFRLLKAAIKDYSPKDTVIIIDGAYVPKRLPEELKAYRILAVPKGDTKITSCSAASVLAKVEHDRMTTWLCQDPEIAKYHLEASQGYCTKEHLKALKDYGPSWVHRTNNKVIKEILKLRAETWENPDQKKQPPEPPTES